MAVPEDTERNSKMGPLYTEPAESVQRVSFLGVLRKQDSRRALVSVVPTLTLGIIGGAVLPLSWAFSVTGIICGVVIMVIVASANAYTSDLLLRQAHVTNTFDYEQLAFVIGGKWWQLATEVSIVVLLVGSLIGSIAQLGEVGSIGLLAFNSSLPSWLVGSSGRVIMVFAVAVLVFPLCLVNKLRQLEYAGIGGTLIVLWLMVTVMVDSIAHGLPSIKNHQLQTVGFTSIGNVTQAVSIFGFAFYVQPMMMPMLGEVPAGRVGVKVVSYSTRIVVLVNAFFIYFFTGFFGAAYYGVNTSSNILENEWLGGGIPQGILNIAMAVYLAIANPVLEFPTRHTIEGWLPHKWLKGKMKRHLLITSCILGFSLAIALAIPGSSGDILVVTGATGVCMVSYLIPVVNHLLLHYNRSKFQKEALARTVPGSTNSTVHGPNGPAAADLEGNKAMLPSTYRHHRSGTCMSGVKEISRDVLLPILVLIFGVFCSISALTTL